MSLPHNPFIIKTDLSDGCEGENPLFYGEERSKSCQHENRFQNYENSRNLKKIEETES